MGALGSEDEEGAPTEQLPIGYGRRVGMIAMPPRPRDMSTEQSCTRVVFGFAGATPWVPYYHLGVACPVPPGAFAWSHGRTDPLFCWCR